MTGKLVVVSFSLLHCVCTHVYSLLPVFQILIVSLNFFICFCSINNSIQHSWWHGSDKNMNWGAFPYGYVYCNMEREGAAYLLLPKDWAVHESTGNKSKLGTFSYETKILTTITNEEKDWSGAKLL